MAYRKRRKLRLKKGAYVVIVLLILLVVGIVKGIEYKRQKDYEATYEYKLITKGYSLEDAKFLDSKYDNAKKDKLLELESTDNIIDLINQKYFLFRNLDTYLEYIKDNDSEELSEVVAICNVHANNKWYTYDLDTDISKKELMIVNKFYTMDKSYEPANMKSISLSYSYGSEGDNQLIDYAYDKFMEMAEEANEAGFHLMVTSSYRNYEDQEEIYNYRKTSYGERKADQTAARPGHSEHQSGLVIDMTSKEEAYADEFSVSETYKWLKENAYRYGFIERYPEGKTYLTGYSAESWHWRYVGVKAATTIHEENITFDEYYEYYVLGDN